MNNDKISLEHKSELW